MKEEKDKKLKQELDEWYKEYKQKENIWKI